MGVTYPSLSFLSLILLVSFAGCRQDSMGQKSPPLTQIEQEKPELAMSRLQIQFYGDQGLEWTLQSPQAQGFTTKNYMWAENIHVELYDNGEMSSIIEAKKGVFNTRNENTDPTREPEKVDGFQLYPGDMVLEGDVVVISTDGAKLMTDWLRYRKKTDLIKSTAPVKVVRKDSITHGDGMEATADLSKLKIFNQTLIIKGDDEPLIKE